MAGWIAWIGEKLEEKVPGLGTDPFNRFKNGIQIETCIKCGKQVSFISEDGDFAWSQYDHDSIAGLLAAQVDHKLCPDHPKPYWMT